MEPYYEDDFVMLFHGDCQEVTEWLKADVLVTDPPYGIGWSMQSGEAMGGLGSAMMRNNLYERPGIANDDTTAVRDAALAAWQSRPALVFGAPLLPPPVGTRQVLTWVKPLNAGVIGSTLPWRRDTENVYVLGAWPVTRGKGSVKPSSVLIGPSGLRSYNDGSHSHMKPISVMQALITACPAGTIADPFAGSGSTLVAAKQLGRHAVGVELDERYCELAAKRLTQDTLFGESA